MKTLWKIVRKNFIMYHAQKHIYVKIMKYCIQRYYVQSLINDIVYEYEHFSNIFCIVILLINFVQWMCTHSLDKTT